MMLVHCWQLVCHTARSAWPHNDGLSPCSSGSTRDTRPLRAVPPSLNREGARSGNQPPGRQSGWALWPSHDAECCPPVHGPCCSSHERQIALPPGHPLHHLEIRRRAICRSHRSRSCSCRCRTCCTRLLTYQRGPLLGVFPGQVVLAACDFFSSMTVHCARALRACS